MQSLNTMLDRLVYKQMLQRISEKKISLESFPLLKMYYLADKDRLSTFFRLEEESTHIFDQIEKLAKDHLGISKQYFLDKNQFTMSLKDAIKLNQDHLFLFV